MGSEIITIHLGQAGVQISHALWELVCLEHGVNAEGRLIPEPSEFQEEEFGRNFVFREVSQNKFVPRALLVDLEPSVVDEIKTGAYRELWHPQQLITGKEDAASNFARGYYSQSRFEMSEVMDRIRILVEQCENFSSFKLLYSTNGGTGSGLTSALCERLSDEYGKKYKFATTVYPSPGYSELMVEPYNALLHSSTNLTFCDCVVMMDNEAMLNVVEDSLRQNHSGFTIPNRVIATAVTTQFLSHRYRFIGQQHAHVSELLINLIPYPRIHFPMMAFAPFLSPDCQRFEKCTPIDLVRSVFEDTNQLLSVSALRRAYISCALLFRGSVTPIEAVNAVTALKADRMNRARFVDWCPTGFKLGVNFAPPVQAAPVNTLTLKHTSLTMIAGNLAVRDVWTGIGRRFDQLYQKRAYVHWYVAEGMEEGEFTLAREVIQQLVDDYEAIAKDAESTVLDSSTNYAQDQPIKPIIRATPRINRSPLNRTEPNVNQATTLDDPNSLRTLENNEDAISLDTNQHHSNSAQADVYQATRARLNDLDDTRVDWRLIKALPGTHAQNADAIPNVHPTRKRRLHFPKSSQMSTRPENAYLAEHNPNSAQGLTVLARSGIVYGTNCSAAVKQHSRPRRITHMEVGTSDQKNERFSAHSQPKTHMMKTLSNLPLTPVIEEQSSIRSYDLRSTPIMKDSYPQAEAIEQNYSSSRVQYYRSACDGSNRSYLFDQSPSICSAKSQNSVCSSECDAASLNTSASHSSLQFQKSIEDSKFRNIHRDPGTSSLVSHCSSSRTVRSNCAESIQDTFSDSQHDAQSWAAQVSSNKRLISLPAESELSPPQITPLRSPLALTQQSRAELSQTDQLSSTFSRNRPVGPLVCCTQLRKHRHSQREKHYLSHRHSHHYHHRHHHHHPNHNHQNDTAKHQGPCDNQNITSMSQPTNTKSRYHIDVTVEDDEHICTSNDVSEITIRSSKSANPDENGLHTECHSSQAHGSITPIYTGNHHAQRHSAISPGTDVAEYSHTVIAEDRCGRSTPIKQFHLTREILTPSVECPLYSESSLPPSVELQVNETGSNTQCVQPSREANLEDRTSTRNYRYHQVERVVNNSQSKILSDNYRPKFLSTTVIKVAKPL